MAIAKPQGTESWRGDLAAVGVLDWRTAIDGVCERWSGHRLCRRHAENRTTSAGAVAHSCLPGKEGWSQYGHLRLRSEAGWCAAREGRAWGKYVYADRPAGHHEIVISEPLFPGDTRREIAMESGRTHFYLIRTTARHNAVSGVALVGGLAGAVIASAATSRDDNPGPADLFPLDEAAAKATLADLQLAN